MHSAVSTNSGGNQTVIGNTEISFWSVKHAKLISPFMMDVGYLLGEIIMLEDHVGYLLSEIIMLKDIVRLSWLEF